MVRRFWRLLERRERRALVSLVPLMLVAAAVEVVGVAAVIPFLSVLADPDSLPGLPLVGPLVIASEIDDVGVLVRLTGLLLAAVILLANIVLIVKQYWLLRFSWSLNHTLSTRLLRHYLRQAYVFTLTRNTGGMTNKRFGRVGDVPVIGAGTYASNASCAVSATGHGEYFIRNVVSREICARMEHRGESLQAAAEAVVMDQLYDHGGTGGIIAIDRDGHFSLVLNTPGMYRGHYMAGGEPFTAIYSDEGDGR